MEIRSLGQQLLEAVWQREDEEEVTSILNQSNELSRYSDENLTTALHCAASKGNQRILQILIDKGADLEARDVAMMTPLMASCREGQLSCCKFLRDQGSLIHGIVDKGGASMLSWACLKGHSDVVDWLLDGDFKVTTRDEEVQGNRPLALACVVGNIKVARSLVERSDDILELVNHRNKRGETAVYNATARGHLEVLEYLASKGAYLKDINDQKETAMMVALRCGHKRVAEWAKSHGNSMGDRNARGFTPLLLSTYYNRPDMVHWCLINGSTLKESTADGGTAFLLASSKGMDQMMDYLLQVDPACIGDRASNGMDALAIAKNSNQDRSITFLMRKRSDIFYKNLYQSLKWTFGIVISGFIIWRTVKERRS